MVFQEQKEMEVNVPLEKLWAAWKDMPNLMPKLAPEHCSSVEKHGDGLVIIHFGPAAKQKLGVDHIKEKVVVDDEKKTFTTTVVEGGGLGKHYTSKKSHVSFKPGKDAGSTCICHDLEMEPIGNYNNEDVAKEGLAFLKKLEAHLAKN